MSRTTRRKHGNRAWTQYRYWKFTNEPEGIDLEWIKLMQRDKLGSCDKCRGFKETVKVKRRSAQQKELARIKKMGYTDYIDSMTYDKGWWILW